MIISHRLQPLNQHQCKTTSEEENGNRSDLTESNPDQSHPLPIESDWFNEPIPSIGVIIDAETQIKSISFEEYNGLLQLIPKKAKLNMANERLQNEMKKRDGIIKEMQEVHIREMSMKKTYPSLTMVYIISFIRFIMINAYKFSPYIYHNILGTG